MHGATGPMRGIGRVTNVESELFASAVTLWEPDEGGPNHRDGAPTGASLMTDDLRIQRARLVPVL